MSTERLRYNSRLYTQVFISEPKCIESIIVKAADLLLLIPYADAHT